MANHQVKLLALDHRNGPWKRVEHLKPSAIKILIGMVRKADAIGQIEADPLDDPDGLSAFPRGDCERLHNGFMLALSQVNPNQIEVVRQSAP